MTTVLIVDDHPGFRRIARALLEHEGFDVVGEAATSCDAMDSVREMAPDVVLLDVQLPDTNGFDTADALQREPSPPDVVLVSTRTAADYGPSVARSPARGFISKADLTAAGLKALLGPR